MSTVLEEAKADISDCEFELWFRSLVGSTRPDIIVAIARGAARLLQIHGLLDGCLNTPVVSQHALPFLTDSEIQGKRVLVFDDSIIYGSTMSEVSGDLISRGAIVTHSAYVVDEQSFLGDQIPNSKPSPHIRLRPQYCKAISHDSIRRHHANLVRQVFHAGLHLNLDFPTLVIKLDSLIPEEIPFIIRLLRQNELFKSCHNVTWPLFGNSGVERWTALHDWAPLKISSSEVLPRFNTKTRITFVPETKEIRITPIVQYAIRDGAKKSSVEFNSPQVQELWNSLGFDAEIHNVNYSAALLRLLTFFSSTVLANDLNRIVLEMLEQEYHVIESCFDETDPMLVLGPAPATRMLAVWKELQGIQPSLITPFCDSEKMLFCHAKELQSQIKTYTEKYPKYRPRPNDEPTEVLGKLFLILQSITDSDSEREKNPNSNRLKVGLSFAGIKELLAEEFEVVLSSEQISLALDYCIDRALAVPKIIYANGWLLREFYCGEDSKNIQGEQLRVQIHSVLSALKGKKKEFALSPFDLQKICVTVKRLCQFFPVQVGPNNFGMTCSVGDADLVSWLTPTDNPPLKEEVREVEKRSKKTTQTALVLNPNYDPPVEPTWPDKEEYEFHEAFRATHKLFKKLTTDEKLLLSTCSNAYDAFQAIAYEIDAWCDGQNKRSFGNLLSASINDLTKSGKLKNDIPNIIFWLLTEINEANKKWRIWSKDYHSLRDGILKKLDSNPDIRRWWRAVNGNQLFSKQLDERTEFAFDRLMPLVRLAELQTYFVVCYMLESNIITEPELNAAWHKHHLRFGNEQSFLSHRKLGCSGIRKKYDNLLAMAHKTYSLDLHRNLPCHPAIVSSPKKIDEDSGVIATFLKEVENCFEEIANAVHEVAPRAESGSGKKLFGLSSCRAALEGKGTVRPLDAEFVLSARFVEGDSSKYPDLLNELIETTSDSRVANLDHISFQSGEILFNACSRYPEVLWAIANLTKDTHHRLYPKSVQLVFGLTWGKVNVELSSDKTAIKDADKTKTVSFSEFLTKQEIGGHALDASQLRLVISHKVTSAAHNLKAKSQLIDTIVCEFEGRPQIAHIIDKRIENSIKDQPILIFISTSDSNSDISQVVEIRKHLANLEREQLISLWHKSDIQGGDDIGNELRKRLITAPVIILLISVDFIADNFANLQMHHAKARQLWGDAHLIPVLLRSADLTGTCISDSKFFPKDGKSISSIDDRDSAWVEVVEEVRRIAIETRSSK